MAGLADTKKPQKLSKRSREEEPSERKTKKRRPSNDAVDKVKALEDAVQASQKNYNQIAELIAIARSDDNSDASSAACVSLCRVFARLLSQDRLSKLPEGASKNETIILDWLRQRYASFKAVLEGLARDSSPERQELAVTLFMQLSKQEADCVKSKEEAPFRTGLFRTALRAVLFQDAQSSAMTAFVERFFVVYDDVRYYTYLALADELAEGRDQRTEAALVQSAFRTLTSAPLLPEAGKLKSFLSKPVPKKDQKPSYTKASAHRKHAQRAWIALLECELDASQRKHVLRILTKKIVPFFTEPLRLMDFLTDSFNEGGSTALLALSGMFEMMTTCNLDYPQFYDKLYSLLDDDILHSAHRSRFFRLLNQFLSSTHVPVVMIASFIKKLARLALNAPPAAIVVVIPLAYNLLHEHRSCTFMLHREMRTDEEKQLVELEGAEDPFDPNEKDPMKTGAIDSCLWELVALQNHYHPNVASLATILSRQFTKPSYSLEDFLDYSYGTLLHAELDKEVKKAPVVEWEIPKKIFTTEEGDDALNVSILRMMQEG